MSKIELKPCPFCEAFGMSKRLDEQTEIVDNDFSHKYTAALVSETYYKGNLRGQSKHCGYELRYCPSCGKSLQVSDNKSNHQSCKKCKYYTPDPGYRDGDMGNCRYLEKIREKPFYVNEARTECEHFQAAERIHENGDET